MEFLVDMVTTVPDGTTHAEVDAIRIREAARSRELASGPRTRPNWSVLSSMPLRAWRHHTVTPLTAHPATRIAATS